jgi:hypothetical protein
MTDKKIRSQGNLILGDTLSVDETNGYFGIGTSSPNAPVSINTGISGVNLDIPNQGSGSIDIGNLSSGSAVPTIVGKSTTSSGLFLAAATSDGNTQPDIQFSVREDDNTDFSTLAGKTAFRWMRFTTRLGQVSREGAWEFGPSGGGVTHIMNGALRINSADTEKLILDSTSATGSSQLSFDQVGTRRAYIQYNGTSEALRLITEADSRIEISSDTIRILQASTAAADAAVQATVRNTGTTPANKLMNFKIGGSGTNGGAIVADGASAVDFGAFSDRRLKENIESVHGELDRIRSLRPVFFNYLTSPEVKEVGVIAQEIEEVYPDAVSYVGEETEEMKVVGGWSKTQTRIVAALQELADYVDEVKEELKAADDALAARIDALENP